MNEELEQPKKRRISRRAAVMLLAVLVFAAGMGIEVWKHSEGRIRSMLENNRQSFEACAEFFGSSVMPGEDAAGTEEQADPEKKQSVYASVSKLEEVYSSLPIAADITALDDAGVQKITRYGDEVRFYTDINSGLCFIPPDKAEGYPESFLELNRIEGDWYRFGQDEKKK